MEKIKTVYQTDEEGFFCGETLAHQDPRNKSRWLIPAGAVEEAPPECKEDEAAQYHDGKWKLVSKVEEKAEEGAEEDLQTEAGPAQETVQVKKKSAKKKK